MSPESCYKCGKADRHTYIRFLCENCLDKTEERPPDATGKELIAEFLRDWRWGRVYEEHRLSHSLKYLCICHVWSWDYWKWFEEKWEKRLEESLKN